MTAYKVKFWEADWNVSNDQTPVKLYTIHCELLIENLQITELWSLRKLLKLNRRTLKNGINVILHSILLFMQRD